MVMMAAVPFPIGVTEIKLPGTDVTVYERSTDPKVVTSYYRDEDKPHAYVRTPGTGKFAAQSGVWRAAVSPDGSRVMAANDLLDDNDCETFQIYGHLTGAIQSVKFPSICTPYSGGWFSWAPDSKRIVQRIFIGQDGQEGFQTIDAGTARTRHVRMPKSYDDFSYIGAPDGEQIVAFDDKTIRFLSPDGKVRRTLTGKGSVAGEENTFSPKGDRFLTGCPEGDVCIWSVKTGKAKGVVPVPKGGMVVHGWWDDDHLIVSRVRGTLREFVVMTLKGKVTRVIADVPKKSYEAQGLELDFSRP